MKITRRQIRRLIREWFSDEHDPVTGERDQYEPDDQRMQQVQDEIYDLASREAGVSLPDIEDRFGGMGIDAAMQAEENGLVFMEDEVFYAGGAHELSAGPGGTRSYMGEGKITKRQLKRIIKEAMVETDPQEVADILWSYMDGDRTRRPYTFGELLEIASGEAGQNVSAYIEPAIEILVNDGVLAREGNAYYNSVGSSLGK